MIVIQNALLKFLLEVYVLGAVVARLVVLLQNFITQH